MFCHQETDWELMLDGWRPKTKEFQTRKEPKNVLSSYKGRNK